MHCSRLVRYGKVQLMTRRRPPIYRTLSAISALLLLVAAPECIVAEPSPQAIRAFNAFAAQVEARLVRQFSPQGAYLPIIASAQQDDVRLRQGELIIADRTSATGTDLPGAMLHDWRGSAFVPGATAEDFLRAMRDFNAYPQIFSPQVLQARVLTHQGNRYQVRMRIQQRQVFTVVMDTAYDVTFQPVDALRGYSISRSTQVSEIESPGTAHERTLGPGKDHGYLWRLNTYWTYRQQDGGLYMQVESISLTRSIPTGLGWAVRPFLQSVPRESIDFTLRSICKQLRK